VSGAGQPHYPLSSEIASSLTLLAMTGGEMFLAMTIGKSPIAMTGGGDRCYQSHERAVSLADKLKLCKNRLIHFFSGNNSKLIR